jgi:hypothetical protein
LRRSLNDAPLSLDDETAIHFTASFSVAFLDENFGFLEEILKACAAGLTSSKTFGKNRVSSAYSEHDADTILEAMTPLASFVRSCTSCQANWLSGLSCFPSLSTQAWVLTNCFNERLNSGCLRRLMTIA